MLLKQAARQGCNLVYRHFISINIHTNQDRRSTNVYFRALVVGCRRTYSANRIAIHRHALYVQLAAAYSHIRFAAAAHSERKLVALNFISIESAYRITTKNRYSIENIYNVVYKIQFLTRHYTAA